MAKSYKVWVSTEEFDKHGEPIGDVDLPECLGKFEGRKALEKATDFVANLPREEGLNMSESNQQEKGQPLRSSTGKTIGAFTGHTKACTLGGCRGVRLRVKWPDGKYTWPCSKGLGTPTSGTNKGHLTIRGSIAVYTGF